MSKYKFVIGFIVVSTIVMVVLENYAIMEGIETDIETDETNTTEEEPETEPELETDPDADPATEGDDNDVDTPPPGIGGDEPKKDGMSTGMIAGLVALGVLIVGGGGALMYMKMKKPKIEP